MVAKLRAQVRWLSFGLGLELQGPARRWLTDRPRYAGVGRQPQRGERDRPAGSDGQRRAGVLLGWGAAQGRGRSRNPHRAWHEQTRRPPGFARGHTLAPPRGATFVL